MSVEQEEAPVVVSKSKGKSSLKSTKVVPVPQLTSNPYGRPASSKGK